jgi:hypothetical protein
VLANQRELSLHLFLQVCGVGICALETFAEAAVFKLLLDRYFIQRRSILNVHFEDGVEI